MYNKKILQLFKNPKHSGSLKNADGIGEVINPSCGDSMRVFIKVKDGKISDIKIETLGCVAAIASSEALASLVKGKTLDDALKVSKKEIIEFLGGDVPEAKQHCSILASIAMKKAIESYKDKHK